MDRSLQPVLDQTNDYLSNYTNGNIDIPYRLRQINRAMEYVHRRMGFPSDETIFTFEYTQGNAYTTLPVDFDEPIALVYHNACENRPENNWEWQPYPYILQTNGARYGTRQKNFGTTNINGSKQLIQMGRNLRQGNIINPFSTTNLVTATNDATSLAVDNNQFVAGGGSLSFTIDPTLGHGKGSINVTGFGFMDFSGYHLNQAVFQIQSYLPSVNLSSINLVIGSSPTDYYTFSADTIPSGLPFSVNQWNPTQYTFQNAVISGSPNDKEINFYRFDYVEDGSFGSVAIPFFRIDDFAAFFPDDMDLIFYSQYKGTDSTGTTNKIILDSTNDLPNFMQFYPDLLNPVALRAAYLIAPSLARDKDFWAMYKTDCEDELKVLGKIYPRKRIVNLGQTILRRP